MGAATENDPIPSASPASPSTASTNRAWLDRLPFSDTQDFQDARRGFLGSWDAPVLKGDGSVVWDISRFSFLEPEDAPDSVHPSLWRQARLNRISGLFEVAEGIYQVRGLDIANATFVEGETGLVIVDPLTTEEGARAAGEILSPFWHYRRFMHYKRPIVYS